MTAMHADAHAHLYPCCELGSVLRAALRRAETLDGPLSLLLCESRGLDVFSLLRERAARPSGGLEGDLTLRATSERTSIAVRAQSGGPSLALIAGRQLLSREGVEVLALGLDPGQPLAGVADRAEPAADLLAGALAAGALGVLPWGLGKWLGARGARIAALAAQPRFAEHPRFFLGDVAQRAWPWPEPALFAAHRVLAGSDPLPVPGAGSRVARYGLRVEGEFDPEAPARSLLSALAARGPVGRYGRRETILETIREQLAYRARRAASRSPGSAARCASIC
jgi:hypothetical protein